MDKKQTAAAASGAVAGAAAAKLVDFALMGGLMFTAVGAVGFAAYETMLDDRTPIFNGMQYLAIFAQPRHRPPGAYEAKSALDMNPLGSLPRATPVDVGGYALVGAQSRFAWLRDGNRIFAVNPGDEVPRLGRVASIEPRDGRWALIGPRGEVLIVGGAAEIGNPASVRFDKRMIFKEAR